jgi:hypothetical protein
MGEDGKCCCEEKHKDHICILSRRGLALKVKTLTCNPNVVCEQCGLVANSEDNVCIPVPLFL